MLCFGFLLLVATSALAAPSDYYDLVSLDLIDSDEAGVTKDIGRSNPLIDGLSTIIDEGEKNVYILTLQQIMNDLASKPSEVAQGLALSQAIAVALEFSTGIPGDACTYAGFINSYVDGLSRRDLEGFIIHITRLLNRLVHVKQNPRSARYSVGHNTGCIGGGRSYQFEPAWSAIIANASPVSESYIKEEYCTARRQYNAFDIRNNIEAAAITAFSLPPVARIMTECHGPLSNFVSVLLANKNPNKALNAAKQCLLQSV